MGKAIAFPVSAKVMDLIQLDDATFRTMIDLIVKDLIYSGIARAYTQERLAHLVGRRGLQLAAARCEELKWYENGSQEALHVAEKFSRLDLLLEDLKEYSRTAYLGREVSK
ncbi:hypothetical protein IE4872_PC00258 (plasmid) [Rhizobium gallicum]|uniref:Uncharacterized protein n=1 Tax=Rhizobium gallicum TaxID=56730 RepID=A0A1L5NQV3_9HYPH|nr:hypothetical protein [Rhizobium gallicum]APO70285.1 hypothetical protein IE4872_PC00258 [Rhizobium gallicum]